MSLLVFGMDGARKEYVEEAIERGLMPNMERIIEQGSFGELNSTIPPVTIPAWVSMFSGNQPDKFDAYAMIDITEDYVKKPISSSRWKGEMVWDKIDEEFGVINVPGTSPLWEIDGYMVEGFPMVVSPSVYPEELENELPELSFESSSGGDSEVRETYHRNFEKRKNIFDQIDEEVGVRIEVYQLTDTNAHKSKDLDEVLEAYEKVDKILGKRLEEYDDILVVSDHGFKHIDRMFYTNTWLKEKGYLVEKDKGGAGIKSKIQKIGAPLAESFLRPYLKKLNDFISSSSGVDFSPKSKKEESIDFSKTKAFSFRGGANEYADININDERWEKGFVENKEELIEEIINELQKEQYIREVRRGSEIYDQPDNMPDIVVRVEENVGIGPSIFSKPIFKTDAFVHSRKGIIAAYGDNFTNEKLDEKQIVDIAPTIAHYLGESMNVDGEPIKEVFVEGFKVEGSDLSNVDL
jgi:predicted AlkP superfamily phosphohydrolase/phosphomutase